MPCECGCSTGQPRSDLQHGADCECGCTTGAPEVTDVRSLVDLVKDLDRRVRELETGATARN